MSTYRNGLIDEDFLKLVNARGVFSGLVLGKQTAVPQLSPTAYDVLLHEHKLNFGISLPSSLFKKTVTITVT